MVQVDLEYISAGVNRTTDALDWSSHTSPSHPQGLIAYACQNSVIIFDPETSKVLTTLKGHSDRVTVVHWLKSPSGFHLVSGGADSSIWLWSLGSEGWRREGDALKLSGGVTCIRSLPLPGKPSETLLACSSGDASLYLWTGKCEDRSSWTLLQKLEVGIRMQHALALSPLSPSSSTVLLATGGVDGFVRLFAGCPSTAAPFKELTRLAGHQDWIRSMAFTPSSSGLLLASASQDRNVRLWSIGPSDANTEFLAEYAPRPSFSLEGEGRFEVNAEAVLVGHEDWVQSVVWREEGGAVLLSASMDRSMMLWRKDQSSGLWLAEESLGDAGANHLGYYTARFSPSGLSVVAHGYTGAVHRWVRASPSEPWSPVPASTGHCGAITDLEWLQGGRTPLLLTVSQDQTARIHARLPTDGCLWTEAARPQVHGHDIQCAALVSSSSSSSSDLLFASGSEEKVIRVFEAPAAFSQTLALSAGLPNPPATPKPFGASLPALGLSNKATFAEDLAGGAPGEEDASDFVPQSLPSAVRCPVIEEHLAHNTLWPEVQKVYGHGNDLYCLAAHPSPSAHVLASACKAQSTDAAAVWIWDTHTWTPRCQLDGHSLTVTQLQFSRSGRLLLSCSRDRSWCMFTEAEGGKGFERAAKVEKAHARIIWGIAVNERETLIATGSRDKTVKIWSAQTAGALQTLPAFSAGVTAVSFGPEGMLVVGLETGELFLYSISEDGTKAERVWAADATLRCHADSLSRIRWCRLEGEGNKWLLASAGADHTLKVHSVTL